MAAAGRGRRRLLITGGAGFIGSHLCDELLAAGHAVRVLDNLCPQVHGPARRRPAYLSGEVELVVGDVRDRATVDRALDGVAGVFHLAAAVGVGQSMYEIAEYTSLNNLGTAVLLEAVVARRADVGRLVVASSMSIYGEGLYRDGDGAVSDATERTPEQLRNHEWEVRGPGGDPLSPVPTPESKPPSLASVYALSKFDQERMSLMVGRAYAIPTVALRFFNVFGTRQALSNPYTGVLAIFASRLMNGRPPAIFEDGLQRRDFVSVTDVARACRLALDVPDAAGRVFNIGSGRSYTVREVAERVAKAVGMPHVLPDVSGKYRVGDIRHCFARRPAGQAGAGVRAADAVGGRVGRAGRVAGHPDGRRPGRRGHGRAGPPRAGHLMTGERRDETPMGNGSKPPSPPLPPVGGPPTLITGGCGFIGTNLADRLLAAGRPVVVFDDLSRPGVERNLAYLQRAHGERLLRVDVADVRDAAAVRRAVDSAGAVFHFAAQVAVTTSLDNAIHDFEVNARGTLNVLEAVRAQAVSPPLVFTSTNKGVRRAGRRPPCGWPAGGTSRPTTPSVATASARDRRLDFHSPYGCSKGAADQYVLDYARTFGLPAVAFRMSCIYGPHQCGNEDQGWVAHFLLRALRGEPITLYGDGMQVRDVLYADDLVDGFLHALARMPQVVGHAFNVGGGPANTVSLLEVLDAIADLTGTKPDVRFGQPRPGDQLYYVSDTAKLRRMTGWSPTVSAEAGVAKLHHWLRENGPATKVRPTARAPRTANAPT